MKKVLHIVWAGSTGGISKLVINLTKEQLSHSHYSPAIFIAKSPSKKEVLAEYYESKVPLVFGNFKNGFALSVRKLFRVWTVFRNFDLIHFHVFNPSLALAAYLSKKKIIYMVHGTKGPGRKQSFMNMFLLKLFLNHCVSFITFNSEFTRERSLSHYGLIRIPKATVYNGIVLKKQDDFGYESEKQIATDRTFTICTASIFGKFKRNDLLINAYSGFCRGKKSRLLLIGDGTLKAEMQKQVETLGIEDQTVFTGLVKNPTHYYESAHVCVFPSIGEPFGLAAVEAMATGKPVIVMKDGGGLCEIVKGVDPENVVDGLMGLIQRLEYYYSNKDDEESSKKRKEYVKNFSIERMQAEIDNIYNNLSRSEHI